MNKFNVCAKLRFAQASNLFFKVWITKSTRESKHKEFLPVVYQVDKKVYKKRLRDRYTYKLSRPLLNCSRANITSVCICTKMPVYPDLSNLEIEYSRNRIRRQIIPSIKFFFNPQTENAIFKFSELLSKQLFVNEFAYDK